MSSALAVVEDSRGDLIVARKEPQNAGVTTAIAKLEAALAALPRAGVNTDPFAQLSHLREANAGLDAAIAAARERAARPIPTLEHVHHAIDDADRQLAVARDVIAGHRGWIGADARTRDPGQWGGPGWGGGGRRGGGGDMMGGILGGLVIGSVLDGIFD